MDATRKLPDARHDDAIQAPDVRDPGHARGHELLHFDRLHAHEVADVPDLHDRVDVTGIASICVSVGYRRTANVGGSYLVMTRLLPMTTFKPASTFVCPCIVNSGSSIIGFQTLQLWS